MNREKSGKIEEDEDVQEAVQTVQGAIDKNEETESELIAEGAERTGKPMKEPFFEIAENENGKFIWGLQSDNGRWLATNVKPYERRIDAVNSILLMMRVLKEVPDIKILAATKKR